MRLRGTRANSSGQGLPVAAPRLELSHGEVVWLLRQLGFQGSASDSTFREYIKSLRKLGMPFGERKTKGARRRHPNYSYAHVMELALALSLRVYHVVPDSVLRAIMRNRRTLCRLYRRAYAERFTGSGAPIVLRMDRERPIILRGAFLDLQIDFSGGRLTSIGPLRLVPPVEALRIFAERDLAARAFLPMNLSLLAERLVTAAILVPRLRRAGRPGGMSIRSSRHEPAYAPRVGR